MVTETARFVIATWVRLKCQFGCENYAKSYCCRPHTPTPHETRNILDSYNRAILFHFQWTKGVQRRHDIKKYLDAVLDTERELFLDNFYRAICMLGGPCLLCKECALTQNQPCSFPKKARPSMESCGIDVHSTTHNHNLPLSVLRTEEETRNIYCLLLVD
jgi:predicted metal-binding protein